MENKDKPEITDEQRELMEKEMLFAAAATLGSGKFVDPFDAGKDYIDPVMVVFQAFSEANRVKNKWLETYQFAHFGTAEIIASAIWIKTWNIRPQDIEEYAPRCCGSVPILAFANAMKIMHMRSEIELALDEMMHFGDTGGDFALEESIGCLNEYKNKLNKFKVEAMPPEDRETKK